MTSQPHQEPHKAGPSRHHLHRAALDEFTLCEPAARRAVFVTWGRLARRIAEIAAMHTRASHQEPTAQNLVGVSKSPGQAASPLNAPRTSEATNHRRGHYESTDASGK
jgi:hypothetical protein